MKENITLNNKLVSVLVPAYNHDRYIQDTINSIMEQTYKTIELIIIDDGSKDFTWQKIQEMKDQCEKKFVNVVFETKQNEGTCKTLNKLLSLANGEYVYLIASDDMVKPIAIEEEINFLENNLDYALCVGDDEFIDSQNNVCYYNKQGDITYDIGKAHIKTMKDNFVKRIKKADDFGTYKTLAMGNYIPNGYLIRKSVLDKIGNFTSEAPLEDYWLMLQIAKYSKMKFIDKVFYSYRQHPSNTVKNYDKMIAMTTRTIEYEKQQVKNNNNLLSMWEQKISILDLFFLKIYKIVTWNSKKKYISFFGKNFLIKAK